MYQKRQLETIRQQTLKDIEHIYRDITGFDMSYDKFKSLRREAWKEKNSYLLINRLEKNGSRYRICNESISNYKIFNPQTDPFQHQKCFAYFGVGEV